MKKILVLTSAICFVFTACNKDETATTKTTKSTETVAANSSVPERSLDRSIWETIAAIQNFKSKSGSAAREQQALGGSDSLSIDEAVWLVEATLNSDFDQPYDQEEMLDNAVEHEIPVSNGMIASSDLDALYHQVHDEITAWIGGGKKVIIIDVTPPTNSGSSYRMKINFWGINTRRILCGVPITDPALWCTTDVPFNNICSGGNYPIIDASKVVETQLYCNRPVVSCPQGAYRYFFANVILQTFNNNPMPSSFFPAFPTELFSNTVPVSQHCNYNDFVLSPTQQSGYVQPCMNMITTNPPNGISTVPAVFVMSGHSQLNLQMAFWRHWWNVTVTYGQPICY